MRRWSDGQSAAAKRDAAISMIERAQEILEIKFALRDHRFRAVRIVLKQRPFAAQFPPSVFILRIRPLRVQMQLHVMTLTKSFARVVVPGIR